jgi:hypothetical protein
MRTLVVLGGVLAASVAVAAKLPPPTKLTLVQASCNALPPALPGPCSTAFRFASGQMTMKAIRQPQPTCPKTGQPTEAPGGSFKMKGVTKSGAAFTGSLNAVGFLKTTFGDDANDNCELENVQVPNLQSLQGTLTCRNGTCKGTIYPIQCLPAQCADTPIVSELGAVEVGAQVFGPVLVFDDAGLPLATPGTSLEPSAEP